MRISILTLLLLMVWPISVKAQEISLEEFSGEIILKFKKDAINIEALMEVTSLLEVFQTSTIKPRFPFSKPLSEEVNVWGDSLVDLSKMFYFILSDPTDLNKVLFHLEKSKLLEYYEPYYHQQLFYTPNDPYLDSLYHLDLIKAYDAWDIEKGDTNVVIAIVDTGYDFFHEDNSSQVKFNYADPIDGVDNDADGYVDNFRGWDIADNDNNPIYHTGHGNFVAGCAAAATDNGVGIAAIGFNCKILPIKIENSVLYSPIVRGYEGIVYAADHGANIINCSWGGRSAWKYGQDIINYATFNKNALVIAACGNDDDEVLFYPASYQNVLSVAATYHADDKWTGSSFNHLVDISAPGHEIYSTFFTLDPYLWSSGTSFAAPMVAGAAALVKSYYPQLSALQIGEHLRRTADNIDTIPANSSYKEKLGSGRLNAYRALADDFSPSVRIEDVKYENNTANGDTVHLSIWAKNYLDTALSLSITLRSYSSKIQILDSVFSVDTLLAMHKKTNVSTPFSFKIIEELDDNEEIELKFILKADDYDAYQYRILVLNHQYISIDVNDIQTIASKKGNIGFYDISGRKGGGLSYKQSDGILSCMGLVIGVNADSISDNIYNDSLLYNQDFNTDTNQFDIQPINFSALSKRTQLYDTAVSESMQLKILQDIYAWDEQLWNNFFVIDYQIINESGQDYDSINAGIYADWDILNSMTNQAHFDSALQMVYTKTVGDSLYAAIVLLNDSHQVNAYCFNLHGLEGGIQISDGFSDSDKFIALSTRKDSSGYSVSPYHNDVSTLINIKEFSFLEGDTLQMSFAIIIDENLDSLMQSAKEAYRAFNDNYWTGNDVTDNYWNSEANWSRMRIPDKWTSVRITDHDSIPQIRIDSAECRNLNILENAELELLDSAQIHVYGHFENKGSFSVDTGRFIFCGEKEQVIDAGGSSFHHLLISNSAGVKSQGRITTLGDFELSNNATFSLSGDSLQIYRNFVDSGYFHADSSTIIFMGSENSNVIIGPIPDSLIILYDDFSSFPIDWGGNIGSNHGEFQSIGTNSSGGNSPEIRFHYVNEDSTSRQIIHSAMNTNGMSELNLAFRHFSDNLSAASNYSLQLLYSTDSVNWFSTDWSKTPNGQNIGPQWEMTKLTSVDHALGSSTYYLCFRVEGDLNNINYWYIDDLVLWNDIDGESYIDFYKLILDKDSASLELRFPENVKMNIHDDLHIKNGTLKVP